jgi:hypothetical protein
MNAELEEQEDELLALASIYSQEFKRAVSGLGGEIRVSLDLPRDFSVIVKAGLDSNNSHYFIIYANHLSSQFRDRYMSIELF